MLKASFLNLSFSLYAPLFSSQEIIPTFWIMTPNVEYLARFGEGEVATGPSSASSKACGAQSEKKLMMLTTVETHKGRGEDLF